MDVVLGVMIHSRFAEKRHEDQSEHIKSRHPRHRRAKQPQQDMSLVAGKGFPQNFVFREETRQKRRTCDGESSHEHRPERHGNLVLQRAHLPHVLLMMQGVNHAAGAQEQQRLEEGMRHEVEDAGCKRADAEREKHVTQLAHGRVSEDALDIVLHESDRCREERRDGPNNGDNRHRLRRHLINEVAASNHIDARGYHRCGVDQCANRRRAFHGIGEPYIERNLRRLPCRSHKQCERDANEQRVAHMEGAGHDAFTKLFADLDEINCAEGHKDHHDPDGESPVTHPVHHKRLLRRVARALLVKVVADEQIRTQAHALPSDKHHHVVVAQNQREHGEHEQVQIREEAIVTILLVHVAGGVNVNQESDSRNNEDHDGGKRVEQKSPIHPEIRQRSFRRVGRPGINPFVQPHRVRTMRRIELKQLINGAGREDERNKDESACNDTDHRL